MDVRAKRRLRLLELIELEGGRNKGGIRRVAEKTETSESYLSQILSLKGNRSVADGLARRLESTYGKPQGWMDAYFSDDFVEEMLWVYEHAPDEGKRFIEFTVDAVKSRYLKGGERS